MEVLRFKNFSNMLLEKSIGSEEIRNKWYPDLWWILYVESNSTII